MGNYLQKPITDKNTITGSNEEIAYASCCMQGWRMTQEDAHICELDFLPKESGKKAFIFGVFDGHGGMEVSEYVSRHFVTQL